jgi:hypothetical protein
MKHKIWILKYSTALKKEPYYKKHIYFFTSFKLTQYYKLTTLAADGPFAPSVISNSTL